VAPADAGAASGLVNTAHQLGMALGLAVLSAVAAGAGAGLTGPAAVVEHVGAALTAGSVLLAAALLVVLVVLVPGRRSDRVDVIPADQPKAGAVAGAGPSRTKGALPVPGPTGTATTLNRS
jgi:hypothetical protein